MKSSWRFCCKPVLMLAALLFGVFGFGAAAGAAEGDVSLYTPYASLSAPPGDSISYSVDVINNTSQIQTVELSLDNAPQDWKAQLTAGGRAIQKLSVKPKETQTVNLQVDVPLKVDKGAYTFTLTAKGAASLPLTVNVSAQGTYSTELTTTQPNMQGTAGSNFNYSLTLKNKTAGKQLYALKSDAPQGWTVSFQSGGKDVTSVSVDPNGSQDISVTVTPPDGVKAGSYKLPVSAAGNNTSAQAELEAVVTGTYAIDLSTPSGNLATDITAGSTKKVTMQVKNKGSSPLKDIEMSSNAPVNWEVTFEPSKIANLAPGASTQVTASIKADKNAIAGDYIVSMTSKTAEKSADATLRMTVKTSVLWGWIGILIIIAVIGGVYYLFRTYGRR
ncbi:S-layer domain-containing protein [Gordoniibacillus kamchatkensis]|uniref:S-layer domain-containing protein n=1 Tax=Gordoniibacillus kamchatkensis TaxID=1590651 RepID=A0ABR5AMI2_9BACL|nr:NEW3 domain-containing protein [Paenibacillus sp. VKM B-2647]KIL42211.1 S-layer domain-containing protein [Paenibacillus sp. VKM B-2647]